MSIQSRLRLYKARAEKYSKPWPDCRWEKHHTPDTPRYSEDRGKMFLDSIASIGDDCGTAHDIARLRVTGYYADGFQGATLGGHVVRLRTRKGTLYIPVTSCDARDGVTYYLADAELVPRGSDEDAHDLARRNAALTADRCAEIEAEKEREAWAEEETKQRIADTKAEIHEINREAPAIIRETKKGVGLSPVICQAVRGHVQGLLHRRREMFEMLHTLDVAPWEIINA